MTSSLAVVDLKGKIFGRTIYPPSLVVIAFILAESALPSPLPCHRRQKKKRVQEVAPHSLISTTF